MASLPARVAFDRIPLIGYRYRYSFSWKYPPLYRNIDGIAAGIAVKAFPFMHAL